MNLPFWSLTHIDNQKHLEEFIVIAKSIIYLSRYEYFFGQFAVSMGCENKKIIEYKKCCKVLKDHQVIEKLNAYMGKKNLEPVTLRSFFNIIETASIARQNLHHEDFMSLDIQFENIESHETFKIIKMHVKKIIEAEYLIVIFLSIIKGEKVPPSDYKEVVANWIFGDIEKTLALNVKSDFENRQDSHFEEDILDMEQVIQHDFEIIEDDSHHTTIVTHEEYRKNQQDNIH